MCRPVLPEVLIAGGTQVNDSLARHCGMDAGFGRGTSGRQVNPWGSGTSYQCVRVPVRRGGLMSGSGTQGACDGTFAQDPEWFTTAPAGAITRACEKAGVGGHVQAGVCPPYRGSQPEERRGQRQSDPRILNRFAR